MSKFCRRCGAQLDAGDIYCPDCGQSNAGSPQAAPTRLPAAPAQKATGLSALDAYGLYELFRNAYPEAKRVDAVFNAIAESQERIETLQEEKIAAGQVSPIIAVLLFLFYIIPGIIYIAIKSKKGKAYDAPIEAECERLDALKQQAQGVVMSCRILPRIPYEYRSTLALQTMMRYIRNEQASSWRECTRLLDEQIHRWTLEENSREALILQRYTAMKAEMAADSAAIAAGAAVVGAIGSWL